MHLTPQQIRSSSRGLAQWPGGQAGDELAGALCRRLALVPDARSDVVAEARARLLACGPPSPQVLADVLVDHLRAPVGDPEAATASGRGEAATASGRGETASV